MRNYNMLNLSIERVFGRSIKRYIRSCFLIIGLTATHVNVLAVEGAAYKLGDADLIPAISVVYFNQNNVFRVPDNERDATGIRIKPELLLQSEIGTFGFSTEYLGEYAFSGIDETDYNDHRLRVSGDAVFGRRSQGKVGLEISRRTDQPGSGLAFASDEGFSELPYRDRIALNIEHTYGARNARGNLITGLQLSDNDFNSSGGFSVSSDYTDIEPYVKFSVRMAGTTRGFLEIRQRAQNYSDSADRDRTSVFLGIDWPESEQFGGSAKVGLLDYEIGDQSGSDLGLEVGLFFNPSSFSSFDLTLERSLFDLNDSFDNQNNNNEVTISDEVTLEWDYEWSSRFRHEARLNLDVKERDCASDPQITTTIGVDFSLRFRRWISLGAGLESSQRQFDGCEEDEQDFDYSSQEANIFVRMTL